MITFGVWVLTREIGRSVTWELVDTDAVLEHED
jgi:hypothetical protein